MNLRPGLVGVAIATLLAVVPSGARAQLLSPGKLASAHEELEGLRNCTSCHQLGRSGISAERCLTCHEVVDARIKADKGYHATVPANTCAACHQEHLGTDFALVRLDEATFDHTAVGYPLVESHTDLDCRSCHEPSRIRDPGVLAVKGDRGVLDRTFLGLPNDCAGCHTADSPHGEQFGGRACQDCHDSGLWEEPPNFDHASTEFPLQGSHTEVGCTECHGAGSEARYRPLPFQTCAGCHADPHAGAMQGTCSGCHDTGAWRELKSGALGSSFDHTRTSFTLRGAHTTLDCATCHRTGRPPASELIRIAYRAGTGSRTYPLPVATTCSSCHVDRHAQGGAGRWLGCTTCHAETAWAPSQFGLARHQESALPLTGAHAATPCVACHVDPAGPDHFPLAVGGRSCADCHVADDPHEGRFAPRTCEECHVTSAFEDVTYDHAEVLTSGQSCSGCHASDDPHAGQFEGRDCSSCHVTEQFTIERFDHTTTRFPLDGAHDPAACVSCHVQEGSGAGAFVRYRPLGAECTDCHGGDR